MPETMPDLDFLLKAANYEGDEGSAHSQAARLAVEAISDRFRVIAEMQLKIAQERLKLMDAKQMAVTLQEQGQAL